MCAHSSSESSLEYSHCLTPTFLIHLGVIEIFCSFRLVLEGKACKAITELSRLEFFKSIPSKVFGLSDPENNTSRALNKGGMVNLLLLRTLLVIHQKSRAASFWEKIDSCLFY